MTTEFTKHMKAFGRDYIGDTNQPPMGASTDMGKTTDLTLQLAHG